MTEYKTLKQLFEEAGNKPFDAEDDIHHNIVHIVGITPSDHAIGWELNSGKSFTRTIRESLDVIDYYMYESAESDIARRFMKEWRGK